MTMTEDMSLKVQVKAQQNVTPVTFDNMLLACRKLTRS